MRFYTETPFRLWTPRPVVIIPPAAVPPLPVDRVERFLELSKRSPGLSRRARRRRRGERAAVLRELARCRSPTSRTGWRRTCRPRGTACA